MFFKATLVALSGASIANALVALTNSDYSGITVGVPFNVTWTGQAGLVTLKLKNGPADAQLLVDTIAEGLAGNFYLWTPESVPEGTYNLEIDDSNGDVNYSQQFEILGGTDLPITSQPYPAPTETSTTLVASSTATETSSVTVVVPTYSAEVPSDTVGPSTASLSPPLSTGPPTYGNVSTSTGIYTNSTMTSVSYVVPSTTASATPPPAASTVVTAGAIHQAVQPLAAMLLGVAGLAFLF